MPQAHRLDFVGERHLTALSFEFHYKWNTPFVDDAVWIFDSIRSANSRFPKYPVSDGIGFANWSFSASKTKAS